MDPYNKVFFDNYLSQILGMQDNSFIYIALFMLPHKCLQYLAKYTAPGLQSREQSIKRGFLRLLEYSP